MNYYKIKRYDATNWEGITTTIFFTGCMFDCPGCFNQDIQDFKVGFKFTDEVMDEFIEYSKNPIISGVCILGGEPFQQDLDILYKFIIRLRNEVYKPIHVWTGYKYETLLKDPKKKKILKHIDTLVDGVFIQELKDLNLKYAGSINQRIIDVSTSIKEDKIIELVV